VFLGAEALRVLTTGSGFFAIILGAGFAVFLLLFAILGAFLDIYNYTKL
jgi:hypothetical protein